jgi:hypothetical protein
MEIENINWEYNEVKNIIIEKKDSIWFVGKSNESWQGLQSCSYATNQMLSYQNQMTNQNSQINWQNIQH